MTKKNGDGYKLKPITKTPENSLKKMILNRQRQLKMM